METTSEFDGEMVWVILGVLFCLPAGIYYYFTNKTTKKICPECQETADMEASTCPNCSADISE